MPFRTPYGSHYHTVYGCHGATEACSADGLSPCSDCCGRQGASGADVAGGGAPVAGIAGVPQDAITGDMIAMEYGLDYDSNSGICDTAAQMLREIDSSESRARFARKVAVDLAETNRHNEIVGYVHQTFSSGPFAGVDPDARVDAIAATYMTDAMADAQKRWQSGDDGRGRSLDEVIADTLEEGGYYPFLTPSGRERTRRMAYYELDLAEAFDGACEILRQRREPVPQDIIGGNEASTTGAAATATGLSAPEIDLDITEQRMPEQRKPRKTPSTEAVLQEVEDTSFQQFDKIATVGRQLKPTDYGDGFDVGDVVTYDVGWSMSLPHFALIVRRTPKMIETIDLPTVSIPADQYGQYGTKRPVDVVNLAEEHPTRRTRMGKGGSFSIERHWTHPWDGRGQTYDYMD